MGCDIHLHVETKINGKWEHYAHPFISRCYDLFARMAGVRAYEKNTIFIPPRGMPDGVSFPTYFDYKRWGDDAHDLSWLSAEEAGVIQEWYEKELRPDIKLYHPPLFGYLYGNNIDSYIKYPEDGAHIRKLGYEDARVVFWFDN